MSLLQDLANAEQSIKEGAERLTHVLTRLQALPAEMAKTENAVGNAQAGLLVSTEQLKDAETALLLEEGKVQGSNEKARAASLRSLTEPERMKVLDWELRLIDAKVAHNALTTELSALRAVARIIGGRE